jgi:hypothetical protein
VYKRSREALSALGLGKVSPTCMIRPLCAACGDLKSTIKHTLEQASYMLEANRTAKHVIH